ncbi:MAG: VanZ family protein [Opitutaceae bacterium]
MNRARWFTAERRAWLWPVVIMVLIFTASSRSSVAGPRITHFDKVVHFSVYGLLGTLACRAMRGRSKAWWALLAVSAFGATDEWHQYFVPGRSSELGDWIADTAGAGVAILLYCRWAAYRTLLEKPLRLRSGEKVGSQAGEGGLVGSLLPNKDVRR